MVYYRYGGQIDTYTIEAGALDVATLVSGATLKFFDAQTGGSQYSDISPNADGSFPVSTITTLDGTGGTSLGNWPVFYAPRPTMWVEANAGPRVEVMSNGVADEVVIALAHVAATGNPHGTQIDDLVGVDIASPSNAQVIRYDSGSGTWKNGAAPASVPVVSVPFLLYVASSTAPTVERDRADYVCDGTDDQVEIQAAVSAVQAAGGGVVCLSQGDFTTHATITLNGTDDTGAETEVYLVGAGPGNSRLVPTVSGFTGTSVLSLGHCVRAHVWDLDILVAGALNGIESTRSTGPSGDNRAFWFSSFERLSLSGPGDGSHTGWYMKLGSPFRSRFANIECGGGGNGIWIFSENAAFNPGDLTFDRVFVDTVGNSRTALLLESPTGNGTLNHMTFNLFEAFAAGTGSTGIKITGDEQPARFRFFEVNLEQFATCVDFDNCLSAEFHGSYVTPSAAGKVVRFGQFTGGCRFECQTVQSNGVGTVLIQADNTIGIANTVENVLCQTAGSDTFVYAGAGVVNVARRNIQHTGSGTAPPLHPPRVYAPIAGVVVLVDGATPALNAAQGNHFRLTSAGNRTIAVPSNPTDGQRIIIEHIASGGARTLALNTGTNGFKFGTTITALTATASGATDLIECIWSATSAKWLVYSVNKGT
jgi:hypothetical protein